MENNFDIIIIGGGISGLALANSLKNHDLKVLLLERKPKYVDVNRGDTLYPHSIDALQKWGILNRLLEKGAVKSDMVSIFQSGKDLCDLKIISPARTENNFLLSLNHELIEKSFYENLSDAKNIQVLLGANVMSINENKGQYVSVRYRLGGEEVEATAKMFVASDGRDGQMRKTAGINTQITDFQHDIVILDSDPPKNYNNHTWFYYGKNHPMIIGPLPNNRVRISLIIERENSKKWMMMNEDELTKNIQEEAEIFSQSKVTKSESHLYEIKMSLSDSFYKNNLIFIGDSAHTVHPISGQGMALAISDADFLSQKLLEKNDFAKVAQDYGESRRKIVIDLLEHVANLGNFMVSEDKLVDMARIFIMNNLEAVPMFERQVEAMLQSEVEKF